MDVQQATVKGFGQEWAKFDQSQLPADEKQALFAKYFSLIDWSTRPAMVLDYGCGSGRWAAMVAPLVGHLMAADASSQALEVAKRNVEAPNVSFVDCAPKVLPLNLPFPDEQFDLIFSLGVLHHTGNLCWAISSLAHKLKRGGTLLLYVYYDFDGRPAWFKALWKASDVMRRVISFLPFPIKYAVSQMIAACVYWPLARIAKYFKVPDTWPLKFYANLSFYTMRTDALDRFGTRIECRATKKQITDLLEWAGLTSIRFSENSPYWVCAAVRP